ncbi:DNA-binding protein YbiB [Inhella proteolytica]|uniref:DNA-binding protein YbiB n=1 Tax=Inhella proteolytica TaxID=2795029 RepID=A0A931JA17_9BURK|nr:DNA-binding protein YbiB [Inhella proteolytica]MBH9578820.1 DNA-binding protein YbiB [Inhella proteolytica]
MNEALNLPALIKEIGRGARGARDLDRAQAAALFGAMLDGQVEDLQLGAIVLALRVKGESVEELLGFAEALQARTQRLTPPPGPRLVLLPALNGVRKLLNLMPLLAQHLANRGVPVLIHGRSDFGAARGATFELLQALGHPLCAHPAAAEAALAQQRLAVLPTAALAPGLDALMALRPRLGLRNSAHTLVKLLDPAPGRSVRVVAVTHGDFLDRLGQALPRLTAADGGAALLLKGCEGEAYPHPRRPASLQAWQAGQALELAPGEAVEDPLWETAGDPAADAARLRELLAAGPAAWPLRLRDMALTLERLASYS